MIVKLIFLDFPIPYLLIEDVNFCIKLSNFLQSTISLYKNPGEVIIDYKDVQR